MGWSGVPDRGGSREGKKSLRSNKQQIAEKLKAEKHKALEALPSTSPTPPPPIATEHACPLVDCGVQIISRQFDRDQVKVISRALTEGVQVMVAYTNDSDKTEQLVRVAKENLGTIYTMVGIHSNMIKGANEKVTAQRMDVLREAALRPEAVALFTGLDFSRDMGIRYAQERALAAQMDLASEILLPLVLYSTRAADALVEKISEFREGGASKAETRIAIFGFEGTQQELKAYIDQGCHIIVTGAVCDPGERGEALRSLLASDCPLERLLIASDAPYATPQNIEDAFIREGRNEPSNLPHLLTALAPLYSLSPADLGAQLRSNALSFFGIPLTAAVSVEEEIKGAAGGESVSGAGIAAAPAGPSTSSPAGTSDAGVAGASSTRSPAKSQAGSGQKHRSADQRDIINEEEEQEDEEDGSDNGKEEAGSGDDGGEGEAGKAARKGQEARQGKGSKGSPSSPTKPTQWKAERTAMAAPSTKAGPRSYLSAPAEGAGTGGRAARVAYACRQCRSLLFSELDIVPHSKADKDLAVADFSSTGGGSGAGGGRGGNKGKSSGSSLCSMHFLAPQLPWLQQAATTASSAAAQGAGPGTGSAPQQQGDASTSEDEGGEQEEGHRPGSASAAGTAAGAGTAESSTLVVDGRLGCPTCGTKLGKWANTGSLPCACGVLVPAPAYCALRARVDVVDLRLDLASAVQSTLTLYEARQEDGGEESEESDDEWGKGKGKRKKKMAGAKRTANFSHFRNKHYNAEPKQRSKAPQQQQGGEQGQEDS